MGNVSIIPAALYCRESADESYSKGMSIPGQKQAAYSWAEKNGFKIVAEFVDEHLKGWDMARKALNAMLDEAKSGESRFKAVILWDYDRFSRSAGPGISLADTLERHGIDLISITDGGRVDRITRNIKFVLADEYRRQMGQNILRGHIQSTSLGYAPGGVAPFGFRKARVEVGKALKFKLEPDPETAPWVEWIYRQYADGASALLIARALNLRGIPTPRNRKWSPIQIVKILDNNRPYYLGKMVFNRYKVSKWVDETGKTIINRNPKDSGEWIVAEDAHEPLITRELADRVEKIRKGKRGQKPVPRETKCLLTGLLKCGECGAAYGPRYSRKWHVYYACREKREAYLKGLDRTCFQQNYKAEDLDKTVIEAVLDVVCQADIMEKIVEGYSERDRREEKQWKDERGKARKRLGELQKQKENILAAIAKGLGWDFAQEKVNQITAGIIEAERLLSESAPKKTQIDEREGAYLLLEDTTHVRDELLHDRAAQRGILAAFVEEIVLKDGFATIRWKIPLPDKKICT